MLMITYQNTPSNIDSVPNSNVEHHVKTLFSTSCAPAMASLCNVYIRSPDPHVSGSLNDAASK